MPGGVEDILGAHARLLRDAGHEVTVIAGRGDAQIVPEIDSRHPEIEAMTARLAAGEDVRAALERLSGRVAGALERALAGADLAIAHNAMTMPLNFALTSALAGVAHGAGSGAGIRVLAWTHDVAAVNPRYEAFRRPGVPYSLIQAPQPGVRYVTVSRTRAAELAAAFDVDRRAIRVVPNGIDPEAFLGVGSRTLDLARRAGFEDADPLVLVPVRVTRRKRLEMAIAAAAALLPRMPRLKMVVTGPLGPHDPANAGYQAELDRLREAAGVGASVVFCHQHGQEPGAHPVDGEMMAQLYRLADAVLLPSESEGFGLPVLEAALGRVPVVCADIPILREVGGAGPVTFPPQAGPDAVVEALLRALRSRSARMRRRAIREHSWDVVRPRLLAAIEGSLA